MGEKRGNTGKLLNPYNEGGILEIFHHDLNQWVRVTPRDFRSWGGKRRITEYKYPFRRPVEMSIYEYDGPVYEYLTNNIVSKPIKGNNGVRSESKLTYSENFRSK
jgi:hypothetical protein